MFDCETDKTAHYKKKLIISQRTVSRQVNAPGKNYEWSHFGVGWA